MSGAYISSWIIMFFQDFIVPYRDFSTQKEMMQSLEVTQECLEGLRDGSVERVAWSNPDNLNFIPKSHMVEGDDIV